MPPQIIRLLLTIGFIVTPSIALAQHFNLFSRFCLNKPFPPDIFKPIEIPIGCEIIDCCPGCPGGGLIEMRVNIAATALQGAEIRFEGLEAAAISRLRVSGTGRLAGDRIVMRRGRTIIRGLRSSASGGAVFATLLPLMESRPPERSVTLGAQDADRDTIIATDVVAIKQYIGPYVVQALDWRVLWDPCRPRPVGRDQLKSQSIVGGDNVVVLMDARTNSTATGCSDDAVLRSVGSNTFVNLRTPSGCNSEVFIFGSSNAMAFDTPVTTWTNVIGDVHTTTLQPIITVPVSVWITDNGAAVPARAANDIANANLLYSQNKVGVQFNATYNNVSANAAAVATVGNASCGAVGPIQASAFYTANTVNIYYVNGAFNGENCARTQPVGDGNISYLGTTGNLATLAHEIGHAFGLRPAGQGGHTNAVAGFDNNNIMWGGGPATRNLFTLGQAFRMNTHTDQWGGTMLINNGLRPGPGRACAPLTTTTQCPALGVDWTRP